LERTEVIVIEHAAFIEPVHVDGARKLDSFGGER